MSSIPAFPDVPRRGRGGFTMMELLVALMISGILVTVVLQLLQGNSMFVRRQSAREEVQQNARAALGLISGDLRAVPPGAITGIGADSIHFYLPRGWGVLCNLVKPSTATAWVLFPSGVLPSDNPFGKAHWGIAVEQTLNPVTHTGSFRFVANATQAGGADPCAAIEPNLTAQHVRYGFTKPGGASFVTADSVFPGTQVMFPEEMRYDVAATATGVVAGNWIRRMIGYGADGQPNMQPMAGPVPATGGLQFTYLKADGATAAAAPADVRQVQIRVITESRAKDRKNGATTAQQVDTMTTTVYLRNTPG